MRDHALELAHHLVARAHTLAKEAEAIPYEEYRRDCMADAAQSARWAADVAGRSGHALAPALVARARALAAQLTH